MFIRGYGGSKRVRFVVTGTGRNGTGYTAQLFNAAGLRCGHEAIFTERPAWGESAAPRVGFVSRVKEPAGRIKEEIRRRHLELDGDSSWMAVPRLPRFRGVRILQVRHPIPVIRSFTGTRFFSEPKHHRAQYRYAAAHFSPVGEDVLDAMRWWVYWNLRAEMSVDLVTRLEDIDTRTFANMLGMILESDAETLAEHAIATVPPNVNSGAQRGEAGRSIKWRDLPKGPELEALTSAAVHFGYEPEMYD
jgi:hypothetical protein